MQDDGLGTRPAHKRFLFVAACLNAASTPAPTPAALMVRWEQSDPRTTRAWHRVTGLQAWHGIGKPNSPGPLPMLSPGSVHAVDFPHRHPEAKSRRTTGWGCGGSGRRPGAVCNCADQHGRALGPGPSSQSLDAFRDLITPSCRHQYLHSRARRRSHTNLRSTRDEAIPSPGRFSLPVPSGPKAAERFGAPG